MPTIARYAEEDDARRRAADEGLEAEYAPSERWPEYPWAVERHQRGVEGAFDVWAERLLEQA